MKQEAAKKKEITEKGILLDPERKSARAAGYSSCAEDSNFKRGGPPIRCHINGLYVNPGVATGATGRVRGAFKEGFRAGGGFKAISRVAKTHPSRCGVTPMFRTSPSGS